MRKTNKQCTLKRAVFLEGIGVHSGKKCRITIEPAKCNEGIRYILTNEGPSGDEGGTRFIVEANYTNVSDTNMCTRITNKFGVTVSVVEHLSAAFYGLGITNATVKLQGSSEIPFLDGSAAKFVEAIVTSGLQEQACNRRQLLIMREIRVGDFKKWACFRPLSSTLSSRLVMKITCDFSVRGLTTEPWVYDSVENDFREELSAARTFGFFEDVEFLRKNHLALGASMDNTVVFGKNGVVLNPEGMRYDNEPVRHKVLDALGDLSLSNYEIIGEYEALCPGHALNNLLLRELFEKSINYLLT